LYCLSFYGGAIGAPDREILMKINDLFSILDHAPDVQMDVVTFALDMLSPDGLAVTSCCCCCCCLV